MRECGLESLQFNWFQAAVRQHNALTQSNRSTARKILQADVSSLIAGSSCTKKRQTCIPCCATPSARTNPCLLNNGSTNSAISSLLLWTFFLLAKTSNKPISLTTWLAVNPEFKLIINCAPSLQRGPLSHISQTSFPGKCFSTFLVTLFRVWHASDFMPTPYFIVQNETVTWTHSTFEKSPILATCAILMTTR